MDVENPLKPCPFCGGEKIAIGPEPEYSIYGMFVYCKNCKASGPLKQSKAVAIKVWNRRADNGR